MMSFLAGSTVKNLPANAGDGETGSIPRSGKSPGEERGFQYSCLGNPLVGGPWQAKVHGVAKESNMT